MVGPGRIAILKDMAPAITTQTVPLTTDSDGIIRVGGTRVPLETVVGAFEAGESAEEIVAGYPSLSLADAYATIAYYLRHRADVRPYLAERRIEASTIQREIESRPGYTDLRERLILRQIRRSLERPTREELQARLRTRERVEPRESIAAAVAAEREGR